MARWTIPALSILTAAGCGFAPPVAVSPAVSSSDEEPPPIDVEAHQVTSSNFDKGTSAPWTAVVLEPAQAESALRDGAFCVDVKDRGYNPWDLQMVHKGLQIENRHSYTVRARVWATSEINLRAKIGMSHEPWSEYWSKQLLIGPTPTWLTGEFIMNAKTDPTGEFAFHFAGALVNSKAVPFTVCIDDIVLVDPDYDAPIAAPQTPVTALVVNQVGYLPGFKKTAVLRSDSEAPVPWQVTRGEKVVGTGYTTVFGNDTASGYHLHHIDFSIVNEEGEDYRIHADGKKSHPFEISPAVYDRMKYDALAYFYHNRSGVPIEMPYAGGAQWSRPAGHEGDAEVPCLPDSGCDYSLDVKGGWYDAGDHGKYVVNAGYSVWALLNQYERAVHLGKSAEAFKDGTLNIPENKNGVPDILDEARFELEFLLKMKVPKGQPLAGMVHHKIHDEDWTGFPTAPHEDPKRRYLHPPTTAATLNLSAVAAQCARVYKDIDAAFAGRCLDAAERTYAAALKHPKMFAAKQSKGGGDYEDDYVQDEFFWAAAELYITTADKKYLKALKKSPHYATLPTVDAVGNRKVDKAVMSWQVVDALGTLSLAIVPNKLKDTELTRLRDKIRQAADKSLQVIDKEGYRTPFASKPDIDYYWGSNFVVMNHMIVLAVAADLTGNTAYRNAVAESMDYLLGRNPLDQCYVTGYGDRPLKNPHHRFWAHQVDPRFPPPPPGGIAGGPNQHLQDPRVKAAVPADCAPATCFVDHIDSYSTNEVAINWNAAFAWVSAYLDEVGKTASH